MSYEKGFKVMHTKKEATTVVRTTPCPAVKSFVFLFLAFVSLFSIHAVAKHVIVSSVEESADLRQESAMDLTQSGSSSESELAVTTAPVKEEFTVSQPVYAAAEVEEKTLWDPLSKSYLTQEQVDLLKLAFDVGYADGGVQHAKLLQATMMQETIAGLLGRIGHMSAPVGKRSYGVMQVKVSAATDVLGYHPDMGKIRSEEELIARLITDDKFNIAVASKHILHLKKFTRNDAQTLMAYNIGLRGSRRHTDHAEFSYVQGVRRFYKQVILPFNEKYRAQYKMASSA